MSDELKVAELREWAAVEVMGWRKKENCAYEWWWTQNLENIGEGVPCSNWHPDTDLNDLAQVVKAWCGEDEGRWQVLDYLIEGEAPEDIEFRTRRIFTNPERVLRALHKCWEAEQ